MSDSLSELEGCDLLARLFAARGYKLSRNVIFREYGVTFHIDGWDAAARVGFEFLTSEDDDHADLTLEGYKTLMAAQQRGELSLFIIDEVETLSAAELGATAHEFLDEVAAAARARTRRLQGSRRKTSPALKSRGGQQAAVSKAAATKKPGAKKLAAKKPAAKKPAAKKIRTGSRAAAAKTGTGRKGAAAGKGNIKAAGQARKRTAKSSTRR